MHVLTKLVSKQSIEALKKTLYQMLILFIRNKSVEYFSRGNGRGILDYACEGALLCLFKDLVEQKCFGGIISTDY